MIRGECIVSGIKCQQEQPLGHSDTSTTQFDTRVDKTLDSAVVIRLNRLMGGAAGLLQKGGAAKGGDGKRFG
ncbi:hypothetical protein SH528x_002752 [Novipirellula sp. SH528]|uniref:hypothetical protein n=1 Tax=Novipirellula sp. SH528 TaxID=3454466 RepID=UPI003FA095B8